MVKRLPWPEGTGPSRGRGPGLPGWRWGWRAGKGHLAASWAKALAMVQQEGGREARPGAGQVCAGQCHVAWVGGRDGGCPALGRCPGHPHDAEFPPAGTTAGDSWQSKVVPRPQGSADTCQESLSVPGSR